MLLNYLKLSLRLMARNPFFTFINVAGLSVGFAVFCILWQHASFELKSDQFHQDHQRIFRLYSDFYYNTGVDWTHGYFGTGHPVFATIILEKFPAVESITRLIHQKNFDEVRWPGPQTDTAGWSELKTNVVLTYIDHRGDEHSFNETKAAYADPNFFSFFSIPLIIGNPDQVLNRADAIVLSESTAVRYFGSIDPLGKTLILNNKESFTVTGVFRDLPHNTHLNVELLISTLNIHYALGNVDPLQQSSVNYLKLKEGVSVSEMENKLTIELNNLWNVQGGFPGSVHTSKLQPLKDIPFHVLDNDSFAPKSKFTNQIFLLVGIVVLVMAWINYLNLKISAQASRMKEIATRKSAGARIMDFVKQFLVESIVINALAVLVALTLIQLLKSPLELWFQFYLPDLKEIGLSSIIVFFGVMTLGILMAALHPALSMWKLTIKSIFNYGRISSQRVSFITISSIVQFIIATVMIVWLVTVSQQVDFVMQNSWGLDRDRVIVLDLPVNGSIHEIWELKDELLATTGIEDVALSTIIAGDLLENRMGFSRMDTAGLYIVPKSDGGVDERFIPFYDLKILAGRNFIRDNPADKKSVILSRVAAKSAGLEPEQAIGKKVLVEKYPWRPFNSEAEIIGVIEDHRYSPLYLEAGLANGNPGTILTYGNYLFEKNQPEKLSIRVNGSNKIIETIHNQYKKRFPGQIFQWYFLVEYMNTHYQSEQTAKNQITLFSFIAIGIACLGLLGLISNRAVEKTKEIGIRKVHGAELYQIAQILLNTTVKQVMIATALGIPVAFYLTQQYLEKFSERIALQWWHFTLPVVILILIMLVTVASVLYKAAKSNPVEALKYE